MVPVVGARGPSRVCSLPFMKAVYAEEPKYFSLTGSITELFLLSLLPPNFGPPWIASDSTACWLALVLGVTVLHTYCRDCLDNYHSVDRRVLQWEYKKKRFLAGKGTIGGTGNN